MRSSSNLSLTEAALKTSNYEHCGGCVDTFKATPSDTLVSGPEVFLIACGRAAFLIMSLSIFHLMNLIILQMNIIITLFCTTWTIMRMRSRNNGIEIQ